MSQTSRLRGPDPGYELLDLMAQTIAFARQHRGLAQHAGRRVGRCLGHVAGDLMRGGLLLFDRVGDRGRDFVVVLMDLQMTVMPSDLIAIVQRGRPDLGGAIED